MRSGIGEALCFEDIQGCSGRGPRAAGCGLRAAGLGSNRQQGPRSGTSRSIRGRCQLKTFNSALRGAPSTPPRGARPREESTDRVKKLVSVCSAFATGIKLADRTLRALDIEPTPIAAANANRGEPL